MTTEKNDGRSYSVFCARDQDSNYIELSYIVYDKDKKVIESESLRNIKGGTGVKGFWAKGYDYTRGKGGIPEGNWFVWINPKYIQQKGQLNAKGHEIGEFYPIGSETDYRTIRNPLDASQVRLDIGNHKDNSIPLSLGCPVVFSQPDFVKVHDFYKKAFENGVEKIPFNVFRKNLS